MSTTQQKLDVLVRWMIRRDMDEVLAIENLSFKHPWTEQDFIRVLRQRNSIGMVASTPDDKVVGFMVYELFKHRIHVLNFASLVLRRGVGMAMVDKLKGKLSIQRRQQIDIEVQDSNLDAQLFLKSQGFVCEGITYDHWSGGIDAYHFVYEVM